MVEPSYSEELYAGDTPVRGFPEPYLFLALAGISRTSLDSAEVLATVHYYFPVRIILIRKTLATLALCTAGIATIGLGTASAQPAEYYDTYDTSKQCSAAGRIGEASDMWYGWGCERNPADKSKWDLFVMR